MATDKQKEAARRNIAKARQAQSARAHGEDVPRRDEGLSTADKDALDDRVFAFPTERKEPLTDARHVRNAIARFDQVEGVSDAERDKAWKRILSAAKRFDVDVSESDWRDLAHRGNDRALRVVPERHVLRQPDLGAARVRPRVEFALRTVILARRPVDRLPEVVRAVWVLPLSRLLRVVAGAG
jgi:hypothetical protein